MLLNLKALMGQGLVNEDGRIGDVTDFLFDDEKWTVRYIVVKTGGLLSRNETLISPQALVALDLENSLIRIGLTSKQVEESPDISANLPLSRQMESRYHDYYGWPYYWNGVYAWGAFPMLGASPAIPPGALVDRDAVSHESLAQQRQMAEDNHIRSFSEVLGYQLDTPDATFGEIEDFFISDESWTVRYLEIDTVKWMPSRSVLFLPQLIDSVSWETRTITTTLSKEKIKGAPTYDAKPAITRDYEEVLGRYYGVPPYWQTEANESSLARQKYKKIG